MLPHHVTPFRFIIIGTMLGMTAIAWLLWLRDPSVVEENHLVEWMQVVFLTAAAAMHLVRSRHSNTRADHIVRLVAALLCISLAVRELDINELTSALSLPAGETTVRAGVVVLWVILSWRVVVWFDTLWRRRFVLTLSRVGFLTLAAGFLYITSWPFDKYPGTFGILRARGIEEVLQLNASFLLFIASCSALPNKPEPPADQ